MKRKYKLTLAIIVGILSVAIILINLNKKIAVHPYTIQKSTLQHTIEETGTVSSVEKLTISSEISGKVLYAAKENTSVQKGQLLMQVDTSDLNYQIEDLKGKQTSIQGQRELSNPTLYQAQIDAQELEIQSTEKNIEITLKNLNDAKILYENGSISQDERNNIQLSYDQLLLKKAAQEKQLSLLYEQSKPKSGTDKVYSGQEKSVSENIKLLDEQIKKGALYSPMDAMVSECFAKTGEFVHAQSPAITLMSENKLQIESYVLTDDAVYLNIGDKVKITQKTNSGDLLGMGKISDINQFAVDKISGLGLNEKKVKIIVSIENIGNLKLAANYDVTLNFILKEMQDVITIPKSAIFTTDDENKAVFVIKDGKAILQKVTSSYESTSEYVIDTGLNEGDEIVKDPNVEGLKNNSRIKLISEK